MRALVFLLAVFATPAPGLAQALSVPYPAEPAAPAYPFPTGRTETVNIVLWEGNALPKVYERSEQLPLTDAEIAKLSQAGFASAQLVKMIEERRCACDASADGLVRLKSQGVAPEVLAAISLHALRPNRALTLQVTLDFAGPGTATAGGAPGAQGLPRASFLYFFIDDGPLTRVFSADVGELLSRPRAHEQMLDRSDWLLTREVRRIDIAGALPLKRYGTHQLMVVPAARPTITHPSELKPAERAGAQVYTFDYPRSSLQSVCRLRVGWQRDPVLAYRWTFAGSRFECEWD